MGLNELNTEGLNLEIYSGGLNDKRTKRPREAPSFYGPPKRSIVLKYFLWHVLDFRNVIFEKQRVKKKCDIFFFSVTPVLKILYIEKKDIVNQIK